MKDDLGKLKTEIEKYINKYDIEEFKINIYKLYDKKIIDIKADK